MTANLRILYQGSYRLLVRLSASKLGLHRVLVLLTASMIQSRFSFINCLTTAATVQVKVVDITFIIDYRLSASLINITATFYIYMAIFDFN